MSRYGTVVTGNGYEIADPKIREFQDGQKDGFSKKKIISRPI